MKKLVLLIPLILIVALLQGASTTVVNTQKFVVLNVQVASAGTAQEFVDSPLSVKSFIIFAKSDNSTGVHVAPIDSDESTVDNTGDTGIELQPGAALSFDNLPQELQYSVAGTLIYYDLQNWYVDAETSGDGVIVMGIKK